MLKETALLDAKCYNYFECKKCNYNTYRKSQYERHISTNKHKLLINPNEQVQKSHFECKCGKIYKHQSSLCAHKKKCVQNNSESKNTEINNQQSTNEQVQESHFECKCGKKYKHRQSLFNHKKKCSKLCSETNNQQSTNELVLILLNQNIELQKQIIELCKEKNKEKEV